MNHLQSSNDDAILFGSVISLAMNKNPDNVLFSEGFMSNKLYIKSLNEIGESNTFNFNNCTFKILPFSSESISKTQNLILNEIVKNYVYFSKRGFMI